MRRALMSIGGLLAVGAGAASAQPAPTWNSGYGGWWPGGDGHTWFTISGSTVTYRPRTINPLRIIRNRRVYLGHVYRTVARTKLKEISRPLAP